MKNVRRVLVAAFLVTFASSASADTLWRQYGFNAAHTSYNDTETALSPLTVGRLAFFWTSPVFKVPGFISTSPTLGFDALFFATDGRVRALEKQSGQPRWGRLSCSGEGTVQPAFGHGIVLVGDGGGDLAGYEPATGQQVWCNDEAGSIVSAPAVADDTVFITNSKDAVAVDQFTGRTHWIFTGLDNLGIHLTGSPAIANGVVFVTGDGSVFALDGITGKRIWRKKLEPPGIGNISSASVANGIVYVGGQVGLYALSAADGHLIWKTGLVSVVPTPAIAEGRVFVNSEDPLFGLWAFDANTGAVLWMNQMPNESSSTVTVANGVVYDVSDETGELLMFDAVQGTFLASVRDPDGKFFDDGFGAQPVVANGTVYVSTGDRVDAFRLGP